jgi:hypothetical protein
MENGKLKMENFGIVRMLPGKQTKGVVVGELLPSRGRESKRTKDLRAKATC